MGCGVGLPDVTLFPAIAEALGVPIGALFGEKIEEKVQLGEMTNPERTIADGCVATVFQREWEPCWQIDVAVGNACKILFYDGARDRALLQAVGDPTFVRYFSAENEDGRLLIEVKNPSGSAEKWAPYDRDGLNGENLVRVFTGMAQTDICVTNYLDLCCRASTPEQNAYEVNVALPRTAIA